MNFCTDCGHSVRGSLAVHVWTKAHQRVVAGPVVRRHSALREVRALKRRFAAQEEWSLDDPEPTHKVCRGIPSLEVESHIEPLEAFAANRAYPDGLYVRCRSCHRYYHFEYNQRRAAAAAKAA